jgi:hypothetical protein
VRSPARRFLLQNRVKERAEERTRTAGLLITSWLFNRRRYGPVPMLPFSLCFQYRHDLWALTPTFPQEVEYQFRPSAPRPWTGALRRSAGCSTFVRRLPVNVRLSVSPRCLARLPSSCHLFIEHSRRGTSETYHPPVLARELLNHRPALRLLGNGLHVRGHDLILAQ